MTKIVIENNIPYIRGLLEPFADVEYLPCEAISATTVRQADALVVRTRNQCNEELLAGSKVKFVGTATIGTDHIDLDYCKRAGITVHNAPGCNAPAVAQYVLSTIGTWMEREHITDPHGLTLGVIGVGHVGSIVARWAEQLGFRVLLNDPPLRAASDPRPFVPKSMLYEEADIITIHTPLITDGKNRTMHLVDEVMLDLLSHCHLLINAARGPIVDTEALIAWLHVDKSCSAAIDCWEHEPAISQALLERALVATPHIAGYSLEGKMRGTAMIVEALNQHFGWTAQVPTVEAPYVGANEVTLQEIMASYDPLADTKALRANPEQFEALRNHYQLRHEVQ